jgi:hypothetical protein
MTSEQVEASLRQALSALPPPAGIPPASNNPKIQDVAHAIMQRVMEIIAALTIVGPPSPIVPTPPPPSPTP